MTPRVKLAFKGMPTYGPFSSTLRINNPLRTVAGLPCISRSPRDKGWSRMSQNRLSECGWCASYNPISKWWCLRYRLNNQECRYAIRPFIVRQARQVAFYVVNIEPICTVLREQEQAHRFPAATLRLTEMFACSLNSVKPPLHSLPPHKYQLANRYSPEVVNNTCAYLCCQGLGGKRFFP